MKAAPTVTERSSSKANPSQRHAVPTNHVVAASLEHPVLKGLLPKSAGVVEPAGYWVAESHGIDAVVFIYCAAGEGWCEIGNQRHNICAGDLIVIPPMTQHAYGTEKGHPWQIWWVQAVGSNVDSFLKEFGAQGGNLVFPTGSDPQMPALLHEVLETLDGGNSTTRLISASQALAHLMGRLVLRRSEHRNRFTPTKGRIQASIAYMNENLNRPLQVATLAAIAGVSASHYTALFKRKTGKAPIDYFIQLRMNRARHLLDTTSLSVKEIAGSLGYEDPFYFSRMFKAVHKASPRNYRKVQRQEMVERR